MHEATSKVRTFSDALRFRLLRRVLDRGLSVPPFLQGISVLTILNFARLDYTPARLLEGRALLFRATDGEGTTNQPRV